MKSKRKGVFLSAVAMLSLFGFASCVPTQTEKLTESEAKAGIEVEANPDSLLNLNGGQNVKIVFNGDSANISNTESAEFSNGVLTITGAGSFSLSGTLDNGQVLINAGKNDVVNLVLNGVTLFNESGPAIYSPKSEKVILVLGDNTQNIISDGAVYSDYYNSDGENEANSAIYIKDNLSITGGGTLTVNGNYKHGIQARDFLEITDGVFNITAEGDAIRGRDGVSIQNGDFTLKAGSDGIQSANSEGDSVGFVTINGGRFVIEAGNDGIQAESILTVTGGAFDIVTGGGNSNAPVREGGIGSRDGGNWARSQMPQFEETATEDSVSMKALKARTLIKIIGGEFEIDAEDDGIHSDGDVLIEGGNFVIKTGDDGIHADDSVEISGGDINIPVCYEGIEGKSVTISGGNILIVANDDGINASNGEDGGFPGGGFGGSRGGFTVDEDVFIRISGGTVEVNGSDGLDSNGNIFIEGGTLKVSGPSIAMEAAIECDGDVHIIGGEVITAGYFQTNTAATEQPVILVSYRQQIAEGSLIEIRNAAGNTMLRYTSTIDCTVSGFTHPDFQNGEIYSLFINGEKRVDIAIDGIVTAIADDGGSYSGGGMGGRGGFGGGFGGQMPDFGDMPNRGNMPGRGERQMPGGNFPVGESSLL